MELILNLIWLALGIPAAYVCIRGRRLAARHGFSSLFQSIVLAASILVLVFPLISATDDLMAWQAEAEESGPSNSCFKSVKDGSSDFRNHFSSHPLQVCNIRHRPPCEDWAELALASPSCPDCLLPQTVGSRAPPMK